MKKEEQVVVELNSDEVKKILIEYIKKRFESTVILEDDWWVILMEEGCVRFTLQEKKEAEEASTDD